MKNEICFEIEGNDVIRYTSMPEFGKYTYKKEVVMTKETFQECYEKWIKSQGSEKYWVDNHNGTISCSYCHHWFYKDDRHSYMRHCPYCGVEMTESDE